VSTLFSENKIREISGRHGGGAEPRFAMTITYEDIAKRAFEIWQKEGEVEGREQDHWLQAEAELRKEHLKAQKGKKISSKDPSMLKTPRGENL
jgi:hypothetical protein